MDLIQILNIYSKKKDELNLTLNQFILLYLLYDKQYKLIQNTFEYISSDLEVLHYNTFISISNYKDDLKEIVITTKAKDLFNINSEVIKDIINHLNTTTNSKYSIKTVSTVKLLNARLRNYSPEEIKGVITLKARQWLNTNYSLYLRPETLFDTNKFEGYINEFYRNKPKDDIEIM